LHDQQRHRKGDAGEGDRCGSGGRQDAAGAVDGGSADPVAGLDPDEEAGGNERHDDGDGGEEEEVGAQRVGRGA